MPSVNVPKAQLPPPLCVLHTVPQSFKPSAEKSSKTLSSKHPVTPSTRLAFEDHKRDF